LLPIAPEDALLAAVERAQEASQALAHCLALLDIAVRGQRGARPRRRAA
jgi:hypothetical protein